MNNNTEAIYDLLYFDEGKATSILSQIEGGLLTETETSSASEKARQNAYESKIGFFRGEHDRSLKEVQNLIERRVRHHEIFKRLESVLLSRKLAIDVNESANPEAVQYGDTYEQLVKRSYLKVTGWVRIEDYKRLQILLTSSRSLIHFAARSTLQQRPEMLKIQEQIRSAELQMYLGDKKRKERLTQEIANRKKEEEELFEKLCSALGLDSFPSWMMEGINGLIDAFAKDRIGFIVCPFSEYPEFRITANLRRDLFVGADVEDIIGAYGSKPDVKFSLFGLIANTPPPNNQLRNPLANSSAIPSPTAGEASTVEEATTAIPQVFASLFDASESFEAFMKPAVFPNVTVYPIAVYRNISE